MLSNDGRCRVQEYIQSTYFQGKIPGDVFKNTGISEVRYGAKGSHNARVPEVGLLVLKFTVVTV